MINIETKKKLEKIQRLVLKRQPKARAVRFSDGFQIWINDDPIGVDFYIPKSESILSAWENALMSLKTQQNFNRSHPSKTDGEMTETKMLRIKRRIARGKKEKVTEEKNINDDANYIF